MDISVFINKTILRLFVDFRSSPCSYFFKLQIQKNEVGGEYFNV